MTSLSFSLVQYSTLSFLLAFLQRLHLLKTNIATALMKLNDDSHNTTIIQWSVKLINASSLLPLMTCENKAIKRRRVFILAKATG